MTDTKQDIAPILEVASALEQTILTPTIPVIVEDLLLVHQLVSEVKAKLAGKHCGVFNIFNVLFNLT